jgi:hypothetical protein
MVEAKQSYRERMKAARAAASAQRKAEQTAGQRRVELIATARMMALHAVKLTIRDRGDKVVDYSRAQPRAQANEMMGRWLILKAKERIAERNSRHISRSQRPAVQGVTLNVNHAQNGAPK